MAILVAIGPPAHDAERLAFDFLKGALPGDHTIFTNPTIVNGNGVARELDAVIVAPHAIFVVEIKSWRGRIEGTDHDWYIPNRVPSPLRKNRQTAQMLNTELRTRSYEAGKVWVQGLVFLSHTTDVGDLGPLARDRVVTKKTVVDALTNPAFVKRLSQRRHLAPVTPTLHSELTQLLRPPTRERRAIQSYDLLEQLEGTDRYAEYRAKQRFTNEERVLRVYTLPPDASHERRERLLTRVQWEAQVLRRLGRHEGILDADQPFDDEAGFVLPLEHFPGLTLAGWLDRHRDAAGGSRGLVALWKRIVRTLEFAHDNGVVHRLLRPEAILVEDTATDPAIRVTDFDLAKQTAAGVTVTWTSVPDERRRWSAPEVLQNFSDADHRSDQFSLGALLGFMLAGEPLFSSTADLVREPKLLGRLRDLTVHLPHTVDDVVQRMLSVRPADRFPTLEEALQRIDAALAPRRAVRPPPKAIDPEDLQPGERVGDDYLVEARIGEGGMGVVYAARHRLSGAVHVLKVAKVGSEEAIQAEFHALHKLDHAHIVRPITVSSMIPGRITLVMERAGSQSVAHWLRGLEEPPHPNTLRRLAEDLFDVLGYLEAEADVVHKDLKPDNLLVTEDGGLTVIDFSAVGTPDDEPFAGTPPYRDPAWKRWTHATDRYAAMVSLFEIYVGRHPFGGAAPEPGTAVVVEAGEVDPPGLAAFFESALHPDPSKRPSSATALRERYLKALGEVVEDTDPLPREDTEEIGPDSSLSAVGLSNRAVNQLRRSGVRKVDDLVPLSDAQIRAIRAVGAKTAREIIAFRDRMRRAGIEADRAPLVLAEPLFPPLLTDTEPLATLGLPSGVATRLVDSGLLSVADLACLTRDDVLAIPGLGPSKLTQITRALHQRAQAVHGGADAPDLGSLWERATAKLSDRQQLVLQRTLGWDSEVAERQGDIAEALGVSQPLVSNELRAGLDGLDERVVEAPRDYVLQLVTDIFGGIVHATKVRDRLLDRWDGEPDQAEAWIRLVARVADARVRLMQVEEVDGPVLARAGIDTGDLVRFAQEARHQASGWPLKAPEVSRRALRQILTERQLPGDPLRVATQLLPDLQLTDRGELFESPIQAADALRYALEAEGPPLSIDRMLERVTEAFGRAALTVPRGDLPKLLEPMGYRVQGDRVLDAADGSVETVTPVADPLPPSLAIDPGEQVGAMLEEARSARGFRMLIARPDRHLAVGASVAARLDAPLVSFADRWFRHHEDKLDRLEKAERFAAQRRKLVRATEAVFDELLSERGRPGVATVVSDLGILGSTDALDLVRRWYDATATGERGFWVLVLPGVIHDRQPLFNGRDPIFHLDGVTLPLDALVPARSAS